MKTELVDPISLRVGQRFRAADPEKVATLAESMRTHGLLQPITVRMIGDTEAELVAGLHRLEAARLLEWEWIDAVFVEVNDIEREMLEIAENLHRCDLTKDERDRQIRRYAELLEVREVPAPDQKPGQSVQVSSNVGGRGNKSTATKIAEETGLSPRTVRRVLAEPKPPKPVPPAREPHNDFEVVQKQVDSLMRAWNAAGPEARQQFLDAVDKPVFDSTRAA